MSGIVGLFHRQGAPVEPAALKAMEEAMSGWGPDGHGLWYVGPAGLGQMLLHNTPEAIHERLPRWLPEQKIAFTAEARIDNRGELCDAFGISPCDRSLVPDGDLILKAYLKWGEHCPNRLLGDWSFAAWHPDDRRLFLGRDHHGNTSFYFFCDGNTFAFASDKKALLSLPQVPWTLNELKIAQILVSWSGDGVQTVFDAIRRLPPSHTLSVTPKTLRLKRYWILEETPMLPPRSDADYIEGFLDVFTAAVRARLRSHRPVGATLSGGLDSGSVVAVAAREMKPRRLPAFTAVPLYKIGKAAGKKRFGDEAPYAQATADFAGNIDWIPVPAEKTSPLAGLRRMLDLHSSPVLAAGNQFWITDLMETARSQGLGALLTGQGGNATISWTGWNKRPRWKALARPLMPRSLVSHLRMRQKTGAWRLPRQPWLAFSSIHADLARRVDLAARIAETDHDPYFLGDWPDSRQARWALIKPGRNTGGASSAEVGAGFGLEVRDPTLDKRVMEYCVGLPERIFAAEGAIGRGLIRRSMIGYLPERVRLNGLRGLQAADIGERLKRETSEIYFLLDRFSASPYISRVLDLGRMAAALRSIETRIDRDSCRKAGPILLRGLAVGLFLTQREPRNYGL